MALLVLLAAATWTGLVSTHPGSLADRLSGSRRFFRFAVPATAALEDLPLSLLHLPLQASGFLSGIAGLHPHQLADESMLDGGQHLDEALVAFLLVFLLGILLTVAA